MDRADPEEAGVGGARRLYCAQLPEAGAALELGAEAAQHARVLRLAPGDTLALFDGRGGTLAARIDELRRDLLRCTACGAPQHVARGPEVVLVQCLVKGKKLDDIVRMTCELGVAAIRLAVSERCVAQKSERDGAKAERLMRIAREAARQSEQAYLPEITEPLPLEQVLAGAPEEAARCALTERSEEAFTLPEAARALWLVVGPEGGLSSRDREILSHAKFSAASLGRAILRTETAAVVGVALGLDHLGRRR